VGVILFILLIVTITNKNPRRGNTIVVIGIGIFNLQSVHVVA
jgi:hypothetical protein